MNILRLSILSLTLTIAVVTLGYVTPLQAQLCDAGTFCDRDEDTFFKDHKRCEVCGGETDCDDSDSGLTNDCTDTGLPETLYSVEMVIGNDRTSVADTCTSGTTAGKLDVNFPRNSCPITLDDDLQGENIYCLFGIAVRNTRKGTDVMLFVQQSPCGTEQGGQSWNTGRLAAEIVVGGPGDFKITVNDPTELILKKIHQPNKGSTLDDTIFVGDIIYTVIP